MGTSFHDRNAEGEPQTVQCSCSCVHASSWHPISWSTYLQSNQLNTTPLLVIVRACDFRYQFYRMASAAGRGEATDHACCELVKLSNIVKVLTLL